MPVHRAVVPALAGLALASALPLCACRPRERAPDTLALLQFKQSGQHGVLLNEALVLHFSGELDPSSVTALSVRIVDEQGRAARGELAVSGERITFWPSLPASADLSDAGLLPGQRYEIELLGFPRPDGLRGRRLQPLRASWRGSFRTAEADAEPLFEDASLDHAAPLSARSSRIGTLEAIELECPEPLDPRSVHAADYELRRVLPRSPGRERLPLERVPLRVELKRNERGGARIALWARAPGEGDAPRALAPGEYHLWIDPARNRLRDLGGHPVPPAWSGASPPTLELEVVERVVGPRLGRLREEFVDARLRSPVPVAGADGSAAWSDTGLVHVRYSPAFGRGLDGALELGPGVIAGWIEATRLVVPAGVSCELPEQGLVALGAQGRLELAGTLTRASERPERRRAEGESWLDWSLRVAAGSPSEIASPLASARGAHGEGAALSRWLDAARESGERWTVLLAGGDLVISGALRTDGPLVLVAGGRVRISGWVEASEIWIVGDGGGGEARPTERPLPLAFDAPLGNPLLEELVLAVQSGPIRPQRGPAGWSPASAVGRSGAGSWTVRYLGERELADGGVELVGPVDDPMLLQDCAALRFAVELRVPPGARWDPPALDALELSWDELSPLPQRPTGGG